MKVGDLIEKAVYLSIKDPKFDRIPEEGKTEYLIEFIPELNVAMDGLGKRNPGLSLRSIEQKDIQIDGNLNVAYVDLKDFPFSSIYNVEFLYGNGSQSIPLKELGLTNFFKMAPFRSASSFPHSYTYNTTIQRIYIFPTPSIGGNLNIFGQQGAGNFPENEEGLNREFSPELSPKFLLFLTYYFANDICSMHTIEFSNAKKQEMRRLERELDESFNINYQDTAKTDARFQDIRDVIRGWG